MAGGRVEAAQLATMGARQIGTVPGEERRGGEGTGGAAAGNTLRASVAAVADGCARYRLIGDVLYGLVRKHEKQKAVRI